MNWTLQGGTDAASMILYDSASLPEAFDEQMKAGDFEAIQKADREGHACLLELDSDGGYSLRLQLDEALPEDMAKLAKVFKQQPLFRVASGKVVFDGSEFASRQSPPHQPKDSKIQNTAEIPTGDYELTVYEMDYPEDFHESVFQKELPAAQLRIRNLMDQFASAGCLSFLVLVVSFFFMQRKTWSLFVLPAALLLIVIPLVISRLPLYRLAAKAASAIELRYPVFIAVLKPHPQRN
jgi:hypothetical protein